MLTSEQAKQNQEKYGFNELVEEMESKKETPIANLLCNKSLTISLRYG